MADIQVRKRSNPPWWLWLLGAVLVLGILVWAFGRENRAAGPGPVTEFAEINQPIYTVAALLAMDNAALAGREVQLNDVRVQSVVSDRTFWIGPTDNERVLVVLDQVPTPAQPGVEGRYDVTAGQTINVMGEVRAANDAQFAGTPAAALASDTNVVVYARSLDIVSRP